MYAGRKKLRLSLYLLSAHPNDEVRGETPFPRVRDCSQDHREY